MWKDHSSVSIKFQTLNKGIMAMITPIAFSASIICFDVGIQSTSFNDRTCNGFIPHLLA